MTYIFAHRGSSKDCPENTMAAFKKAYQDGADGIELDVQLSKDGIPVIIHDEKLDRTTNKKGNVNTYTVDELMKVDAGSWFSKKFSSEHVPTLEMFLDWIAPLPMLLNIELKNNVIEYNMIEEKILQLLHQYGMKKRTVISSFNHYSLVKLRKLDPYIETAPLYSSGLFEPWEYVRAVCSKSAHPNYRSLHPYIMEGFKQNNIPIRPYTVNSKKWMKYFFEWEIEAIITDYPVIAKKLLQEGPPDQKGRFLQKWW
ncbi:glycerophosphodiester phosphodiesterase [Fictibacillus nanhaiensis]|uniref:glycerophosphodiester phosphodiesterase n=1 Tax=Fictibacillus nanhaiensis TaxID=742169 RepID=UPI001C952DDE|nr:glycerophosphodiester phosphodiesterase [Fictibacillus nanhaiensis]MBY6035589.1 glycerophosphodiester phosphodiesterase [Fictibacillus nanhaiensis]